MSEMNWSHHVVIPLAVALITSGVTAGIAWGIKTGAIESNAQQIERNEREIIENAQELRSQRDLLIEVRTLQTTIVEQQTEMAADVKRLLRAAE